MELFTDSGFDGYLCGRCNATRSGGANSPDCFCDNSARGIPMLRIKPLPKCGKCVPKEVSYEESHGSCFSIGINGNCGPDCISVDRGTSDCSFDEEDSVEEEG